MIGSDVVIEEKILKFWWVYWIITLSQSATLCLVR